jgi:hypothetical protein
MTREKGCAPVRGAASLSERFVDAPPQPKDPTPVEAMAYRLATPEGKKLYRLRKQMPEPVFGIIKSVLGFRQFLLRGIDKVRGEWSLVTMAPPSQGQALEPEADVHPSARPVRWADPPLRVE